MSGTCREYNKLSRCADYVSTEHQHREEYLKDRVNVNRSDAQTFKSNNNSRMAKQKHSRKLVIIDSLEEANLGKQYLAIMQAYKNKRMMGKGKSVDLDYLANNQRRNKLNEEYQAKMKIKSTHSAFAHHYMRLNNNFSETKKYYPDRYLMKYPKKISHVESTQSYIVKRRRSKLGCHSAMFDDITSHPTVRKSMSHRYHIGSQQKGTKKYNAYRKESATFDVRVDRRKKSRSYHTICELIKSTIPLSSKLNNFYTSNSSLIVSIKELDFLPQRHYYIIPTYESLEEIEEIRQLYNTIKPNAKYYNIENMVTNYLVGDSLSRYETQSKEERDIRTTYDIVKSYIYMIRNCESKYFEDSPQSNVHEYIEQANYLKRKLQRQKKIMYYSMSSSEGELRIAEINYRGSIIGNYMEQCYETKDIINVKSKELEKLDQLIDVLKMEQMQGLKNKDELLKQISTFIKYNKPYLLSSLNNKQQQAVNHTYNRYKIAPNEYPYQNSQKSLSKLSPSYSNSQLSVDTYINKLNIDLLDRAFQDREEYLYQRKQKYLALLYESLKRDKITTETYHIEYFKILKWISYQLKYVREARAKLWIGVHEFKNIILKYNTEMNYMRTEYYEDLQIKKEHKYRDIVKSSSARYLLTSAQQSRKKKEKYKYKKSSNKNMRKPRIIITKNAEIIENNLLKKGNYYRDYHSLDSPLFYEDIFAKQKSPFKDFIMKYKYDQSDFSSYSGLNSLYVEILDSIDEISFVYSPKMSNKKIYIKPYPPKPFYSNYFDLTNMITEIKLDRSPTPLVQDTRSTPVKEEVYVLQPTTSELEQLIVNPNYKDNLFYFIFLDLCIELTAYYVRDSPILTAIFNHIYQTKVQNIKPRGFKTNSNAIKYYLSEFIIHIKDKYADKKIIFRNLCAPLGPTPLDILKYMHSEDEESAEEEQINETVFILDVKLFEEFEREFLKKCNIVTYYEDYEKYRRRKLFVKNAIHIHNKAIFDSLNENLDRFRPFGIQGYPFSWKNTANFYRLHYLAYLNYILLTCSQRILEYSGYMCGLLSDKEDSVLRANPNITEYYLDEIRKSRLEKMLAYDFIENYVKTLFYDDEETEVFVEISSDIFEYLVLELFQYIL